MSIPKQKPPCIHSLIQGGFVYSVFQDGLEPGQKRRIRDAQIPGSRIYAEQIIAQNRDHLDLIFTTLPINQGDGVCGIPIKADGVAVAGAFSLVRFRSAPGSAKEIVTIFLAMGTGLITGMGYLGFAALFTLIMCAAFTVYELLSMERGKSGDVYKTVKITVPEDLDYSGAFDDIFAEYTKACELITVKTTNMGSMFRLTYNVTLRDKYIEKQMIDRIRERNGNLEIVVSKQETRMAEL